MRSVGLCPRLAWLAVVGAFVACGAGDQVAAVREVCDNGRDDDGNGLVDCGDPACLDDAACNPCGDGKATGHEDCDGTDLRGKVCADFGFNSGALACLRQCVFDLRGCSVVELCGNAKDDDGNGLTDCADPACADTPPCAMCGDGLVTGAEQCDDGNDAPEDCCAGCRAEPGCEIEHNDSVDGAMVLALDVNGTAEVKGWIRPAGDVDVFAVAIPQGTTGTLAATVHPFGSDTCIDGQVEIVDASGTVVASSRHGDQVVQPPACSAVHAAGLPAGVARLRVRAKPGAVRAIFGYDLQATLTLAECGDGVVDPGQQCDDGNRADGDGCSSACLLEPAVEHEPDDTRASAAGPFTPPFAIAGTIDLPQDDGFDADWYAIHVPHPANLALELRLLGAPDCSGAYANLTLFAVDGDTTTVVGDSATFPEDRSIACAVLTTGAGHPPPGVGPNYWQLPAGTYYVAVESRPSPGGYTLLATYLSLCGNGVVETGEPCDDGNYTDGDGCTATCTAEPRCGDGFVNQASEECDDGNNDGGDGCSATCTIEPTEPRCGNGAVEPGEECDDGNTTDGDGCSATCTTEPPRCGDHILNQASEQCDDGNDVSGDCCDPSCHIEPGCDEVEPNDTTTQADGPWPVPGAIRGATSGDPDYHAFVLDRAADVRIAVAPPAIAPGPGLCGGPPGLFMFLLNDTLTEIIGISVDDQGCGTLAATLAPGRYLIFVGGLDPIHAYRLQLEYVSRCGDGKVSGTETCDDATPACVADQCRHQAVCGDGILTPPEYCDDGNTLPDDACVPTCTLPGGKGCGNGKLDKGEECDDGNKVDGDGCSATCTLESQTPRCGDGAVNQPSEECDDGNDAGGDGCSATCTTEPGNYYFEHEPNDDGTPGIANSDFLAAAANGPFSASVLIHAAITPFGDDDVFAVANPGAATVHVTAETFGPDGVGTCKDGVDTWLRLRDATAELLGFDDDSGVGACSKLAFDLAAGQTLYVQVTDAGDNSLIPSYFLELRFP